MSDHTKAGVELRETSHYSSDLVSVHFDRHDEDEGFPRSVVLTRDELEQLVQAAWDRYGFAPQPFQTEPRPEPVSQVARELRDDVHLS